MRIYPDGQILYSVRCVLHLFLFTAHISTRSQTFDGNVVSNGSVQLPNGHTNVPLGLGLLRLHNYRYRLRMDAKSTCSTEERLSGLIAEFPPHERQHDSVHEFYEHWYELDYVSALTITHFKGTYSCLRLVLALQRSFAYYILHLYLPSTMLVIVSWVSFWLERTAVPARVTLGVTTLLTMTAQVKLSQSILLKVFLGHRR